MKNLDVFFVGDLDDHITAAIAEFLGEAVEDYDA